MSLELMTYNVEVEPGRKELSLDADPAFFVRAQDVPEDFRVDCELFVDGQLEDIPSLNGEVSVTYAFNPHTSEYAAYFMYHGCVRSIEEADAERISIESTVIGMCTLTHANLDGSA